LRGGHDLHAGSLEPPRARRASRGVWWYACVSVYLRRDFAGGASVVVPGLGRGHGQIRAAPCRPPSFSVADDSLLVVLAAPGPGVRAGAARCTSVDERSCSSAVAGVGSCVCACVRVDSFRCGSAGGLRPTAGAKAVAGPASSLAVLGRASVGRWPKGVPNGPGPRLAASSRRSIIAARLAARSRRRSARSATRGRAFRRFAAASPASVGGCPAYLAATTASDVVGKPPACARSRNRRRGSSRSVLTSVAPAELEDV
jgi:hypothetical protein